MELSTCALLGCTSHRTSERSGFWRWNLDLNAKAQLFTGCFILFLAVSNVYVSFEFAFLAALNRTTPTRVNSTAPTISNNCSSPRPTLKRIQVQVSFFCCLPKLLSVPWLAGVLAGVLAGRFLSVGFESFPSERE